MSELSPQYRRWFWLSLGLTLVAAFCATGYHHPDEYMQILEFANSKIGGISTSELPWEYRETMRPWFQPGLFYSLNYLMNLTGLHNPFWIWSIFRLLHGLLGWWATIQLAAFCEKYCRENSLSKKTTNLIIGSCAFLFFLPWIFTRASSESLSASLILISTLMVLRASPKIFFAGLIAGFSFLSRYQAGFFILGLLLWLLFVKKQDKISVIKYCAGGLVALGLGIAIDSWGYEHFAFSAYNYFYQNIVLNKAAQWGVKPFWYYLVLIQNHGLPLHTLLLTFAFGFSIYKFPKNPFVWMAVPFVLIHSIVGHKEMRFLFPLAVMSPVFLMLWLSKFESWVAWKKWTRLLLVTNFLGLLVLCVWPSRTEVLVQSEIYKLAPDQIVVLGRNPYSLGENPVYYTRPQNMSIMIVNSVEELETRLRADLKTAPIYVVTTGDKVSDIARCEKRWEVFPESISNEMLPKWKETVGSYSLFYCMSFIED